jgi:hypothetical protein
MIRQNLNEVSRQYEKGFSLIRQGDWGNGIRMLEYRNISDFYYPMQGVKTGLSRVPWWVPGQSLRGKALVVCAEQGRGDVIQFSRFIPLIKKATDRPVHLYYYKDLQGLMRRLDGFDGFVDQYSAPENCVKIKTLSLLVMLIEHGVLPNEFKAPFYGSEGVFRNKDIKAPKRDKPLVGICWKTHNDSWNRKSKIIPDSIVESYLSNPNIDFVSLELEKSFMPSYLTSTEWTDTADKIQQLDAVISVDTAVAHMAGSVGVPVYNLVGDREFACWRWYPQDNGKTFWYHSMTTIWFEGYDNWKAGLDQAIDAIEPKEKPKKVGRKKK